MIFKLCFQMFGGVMMVYGRVTSNEQMTIPVETGCRLQCGEYSTDDPKTIFKITGKHCTKTPNSDILW